MPEPALQFIRIKASGSALSEGDMQKFLSCDIESTYGQPDRCILVFDLDAATDPSAALDLGKEFTVEMTPAAGSGDCKVFDGEVTAVEVESVTDRTTFVVQGYDRSHRLHRTQQNKTFIKQKASEMVNTLASAVGMTGAAASTTTEHEFRMQQNQTNADFIAALADEIGYRFWAEGKNLKFDKLGKDTSPTATLAWGRDLHALTVRSTTDAWLKKVTVKAWDMAATSKDNRLVVGEHTPALPSGYPAESVVKGAGDGFGPGTALLVHTSYAENDAKATAEALANHAIDGATQADGRCMGNPKIVVDKLVQIEGYVPRYNGKYRVSWVRHSYSSEHGYTTQFACRGAGEHGLVQLVAQAAAGSNGNSVSHGPAPLSGVITGIVTDIADPEKLGRVKVKIPVLHDTETTDWIRVLQPSAGGTPPRGWFCLPEVDDEVLLAFERGDVRRAYVIGGLWNGVDKPPENADTIKSGTSRRMSYTSKAKSVFLIDDPGDGENPKGAVQLKSGDGNFTFAWDGEDGGGITLETKAGTQKITMNAAGDITVTSKDGKITIDAKSDLTLKSGGNIKIEASQGNVELKGMEIKAEGSTKATLKAAAATVEAGAAGLKLDGGAMAELKGGLVKIN